MRRNHDIGGLDTGPLVLTDHDAPPYAKMITAIRSALGEHDLMRVDELRRALEDLPPEVYARDYYERWVEAMCDLFEEKGLLTRAEIAQRVEAMRARLERQHGSR